MEYPNTQQPIVEQPSQTQPPIPNIARHDSKKIFFWVSVLVLVGVGAFLFIRYYTPIYKEHQKEKVIQSLQENGVYKTEAEKKAVIKQLDANPVLNEADWSATLKKLNSK